MNRTITETQISQFRILLIEDEKSNATVADMRIMLHMNTWICVMTGREI